MTNEIVKYQPELNTIPLRKFTPIEMNLFFSIVSRMRDKRNQTVRFSFEQLKELSNYKPTANNRFIDDIERTYDHLMDLRFGWRSKSGLQRERFVMFTTFEINGESSNPYVDVQIHPKALPLLNNLENWVRYALTEFRDLSSSYAKTMFRLLKQYRTTGYAEFSKKDFNELLCIPESYNSGMLNKRVINPIKEELSPLFQGLVVQKKYGKGRGKPVVGYKFSWKAERKDANDFSQGKLIDQTRKINNVKKNGELSETEKYRALDRIKGLSLGTTEQEILNDNSKQENIDELLARLKETL